VFVHDGLFAEDDIVREFVGVGSTMVREVGFEGMADFGNDRGDTAGVVGLIEIGEDMPDLLVPEFLTYFLMDALVAENGELPIFQGHVDENAVLGSGFVHVECGEDLSGAVERVDIATVAFDVHADFAAGAFFGGLDGGDDELLLRLVERRLLFEEGKRHDINFILLKGPACAGPLVLLDIEMDFGGVLAAGVGLIVRLFVEAEDAREDVIREGLDLEVVIIHGAVEFAAGVVDPVLGAGDIGLEILELLGCLQIGVGFGDGHEAGEGPLEIGLGTLKLAEGSGVIDIDLDLGGACTGGDDLLEGGFLEIGRSFNGLDDAAVQVIPTLVLGFDVPPHIFYGLIGLDEPVVFAAGAASKEEDDKEDDDQGYILRVHF